MQAFHNKRMNEFCHIQKIHKYSASIISQQRGGADPDIKPVTKKVTCKIQLVTNEVVDEAEPEVELTFEIDPVGERNRIRNILSLKMKCVLTERYLIGLDVRLNMD